MNLLIKIDFKIDSFCASQAKKKNKLWRGEEWEKFQQFNEIQDRSESFFVIKPDFKIKQNTYDATEDSETGKARGVMASYKVTQMKLNPPKSNSKFSKNEPKSTSANEQFCNYSHRHCLQNPLPGYEYCIQHIMEDKLAPFKQCNYIHHKTSRRCPNAAPKSDKKEGYCMEHRRKIFVLRKQAGKNRKKKPDTLESMLSDLEKSSHTEINHSKPGLVSSQVQVKNIPTPKLQSSNTMDEYQSDTDSDKDPMLVEEIFRGDIDSDPESLDSDQEDPLKHAGVCTAEEVALIARDKLVRLQSLYIDQFKRLQHVLRERRRKYLKAVKQEKELYGSISSSPKIGSELKTYKKLRALNRYHCKRGKEAVLQHQNKEKRLAATEGLNYKPPHSAKCIHVEDSVRCTTVPLPNTKYCLKRILCSDILHDTHQVLFKPCKFADTGCNKVIVPFQDDSRCVLHTSVPETIEPLVKTLPQGTSPRSYPTMMSDLDKLLCDPDQLLKSLSSTFNSEPDDSICDTSSANFPVNENFEVPSSVQSSLSNIGGPAIHMMAPSASDNNCQYPSKSENMTSSLVDTAGRNTSSLNQPSLFPEPSVTSAVGCSSQQKSTIPNVRIGENDEPSKLPGT
ncbi:KAT8 regulatory NSL complex subunit 2 [Nymphon striatum]|nr:KAT8 regulatory NSL complex subunit 2 [Nymphon striatum]